MMGDKGTWLYAMTKMEFPSMTTMIFDETKHSHNTLFPCSSFA